MRPAKLNQQVCLSGQAGRQTGRPGWQKRRTSRLVDLITENKLLFKLFRFSLSHIIRLGTATETTATTTTTTTTTKMAR